MQLGAGLCALSVGVLRTHLAVSGTNCDFRWLGHGCRLSVQVIYTIEERVRDPATPTVKLAMANGIYRYTP